MSVIFFVIYETGVNLFFTKIDKSYYGNTFLNEEILLQAHGFSYDEWI